MKLSNVQIEFIRATVAREIQIKTLQDDVVDHLCCVLEEQMDPGVEFRDAVTAAIRNLAPNGLRRLEHETHFLLYSKSIQMKKVIYAIGLISAIASSLGICFKLLHLQGADFLLTYGLLVFTLVFLPLQILLWYKANSQASLAGKLKILFALISGLLTGLAIILRLSHVSGPNVDMLFVAGAAIFSFGFLPILFFNLYKKAIA